MPYQYLKKILFVFPVMFLLAILVFFLSNIAPGDKVEAFLDLNGIPVSEDNQIQAQDYSDVAKTLNLDLPLFYFSIHPKAYPDTLYKLGIDSQGNLKKDILKEFPSINDINIVFDNLDILLKNTTQLNDSLIDQIILSQFRNKIFSLKNSTSLNIFNSNLSFFKDYYLKHSSIQTNDIAINTNRFLQSYSKLKSTKYSLSEILPSFSFYGTNNRFHKWFSKVLKLKFGVSIVDGQNVSTKISNSLKWTLLYIIIAYLLTFALAIPLGIYSATNSKKWFVKVIDYIFIAFHSMPMFWFATLSVVLFTSSEISSFFNIFPSIGVGNIESDMSIAEQFRIAAPHLILPSLVIAIHSGAYLSTLIKRNMHLEMGKKYFIALISRGIPKKQVILKHIFPNSILPLITLIVVSLPASIAGSVITEVIFNIPGMGRLLYDSILNYDWNVVFAIVIIIGFFTYIAYMIGDLMYSYFNPKIKI